MGSGDSHPCKREWLGSRSKLVLLKAMEEIRILIIDAMRNLSAYPRWLVASCGLVVTLALLWVAVKILKLTVKVLVALAMLAVILGAVWWGLGYL